MFLLFNNKPQIVDWYSIVGKKEGQGPLGKYFNKIEEDEYMSGSSHEFAERKMFESAIKGVLKTAKSADAVFAGDLLNQIVSSSFAMREIALPFVGIYGACSSMALTLIMASMFVDGGYGDSAVACVGSHFATAERQYRTPLEFGNQRTPTAQWTVTGAGAALIKSRHNRSSSGKTAKNIFIKSATIGSVIDLGIKDVNNMGAAMAPAAIQTIKEHLKKSNAKKNDYDAIFTGDLGLLGEEILRDKLKLTTNYYDCGHLIYDDNQDSHMGGSGCGCSATVLNGFILNKLQSGEYKKILFIATGALLSPTTSFQGETIPCIAHAVEIHAS
ncbi:MAG: stage V sporulation protein AD [Christensenellaceae bacterium]|nr:stage V sporulation protein AD [Christensenellaceae bacterium]